MVVNCSWLRFEEGIICGKKDKANRVIYIPFKYNYQFLVFVLAGLIKSLSSSEGK